MSRFNPWIRGALLLTVAGFITKLLSAVYRVPFQNIVGDHGFYIYQQVYPFYGVIITFMVYGFPMAISKLYAENRKLKSVHLESICLGLIIIGFSGFVLLYFGSSCIAQVMKDQSLAPLFKTLSYLFILFPFIAFRRGLFQGIGNMIPTAASQVGEQFIRVITIIAGAYFLTKAGYDLYDVGNVAVFGSLSGGVMALIILFWFPYRRSIKRWWHFRPNWPLLKSFMILGIVFSMNSLLFVFLQLADSLQLYPLLLADGHGAMDAKVLKGIYDRGQPLIQLGVVLATSFSLALVPGLAKLQARKDNEEIKKYIQLSMKISIVIGLAATVGYVAIMESLNVMLFQTAEGTAVLSVISISVALGSFIMTGFAAMQGLSYFRPLLFVIMATFLGKIGLNYLFVPLLGTMGAAISTVLVLLILVIWVFKWLTLKDLLKGLSFSFFIKLMSALFMMTGAVLAILWLTENMDWLVTSSRVQATFRTVLATVVGGSFYIWLIIKINIFLPEEWQALPFGKYVMKANIFQK